MRQLRRIPTLPTPPRPLHQLSAYGKINNMNFGLVIKNPGKSSS